MKNSSSSASSSSSSADSSSSSAVGNQRKRCFTATHCHQKSSLWNEWMNEWMNESLLLGRVGRFIRLLLSVSCLSSSFTRFMHAHCCFLSVTELFIIFCPAALCRPENYKQLYHVIVNNNNNNNKIIMKLQYWIKLLFFRHLVRCFCLVIFWTSGWENQLVGVFLQHPF